MILSKVVAGFRYFPKLFSEDSLTHRASLNALASVLDYAANIIVGFVVTPFLVVGLGDYYYGVWQILQRLVGYITPASGRPTQVLKFALAKEQHSSDFELKRSYVGSTLIVFALFLPVMIMLGAVLAWFVPSWLKTPGEYVWSVRIACGLLVGNLIASTLREIPHSALEGENIGYKRMGLSTFLVFVGGAITWIALYFKTGIIGVATAALLTTTISGLFFLQVIRTYAPWFGIARPTQDSVREFLGLSWWFVAWNLIMTLMIASDVVVLGLLNSVESVTNYSLSKYAPETAITAVAIMVFGILPGLGGIIGTGDLERAAKVRGEIMALTWLVVTVLGTGVILWNRTFISLWVGPSHFVGAIPNLLIVLVVLQFVMIRTDANVIDLTLHLNRKVILGGISVVISLLAASTLVYFFKMGIIGVSVGILLGRMILTIAYPLLIGRMLKIRASSQVQAIFRPAFTTFFLFLIAFIIEGILPIKMWESPGGWLQFIFSAGLTACFVFGIAFVGGLSRKQQQSILRRVQTVLAISSDKK